MSERFTLTVKRRDPGREFPYEWTVEDSAQTGFRHTAAEGIASTLTGAKFAARRATKKILRREKRGLPGEVLWQEER